MIGELQERARPRSSLGSGMVRIETMIGHNAGPKVWTALCWIDGSLSLEPLWTIADGDLIPWVLERRRTWP